MTSPSSSSTTNHPDPPPPPLPPSSFLPPLRTKPSHTSLLEALSILRSSQKEQGQQQHPTFLSEPYERQVVLAWLEKLILSDFSWLEDGSNDDGHQLDLLEIRTLLVEQSARLLQDFSSSSSTTTTCEKEGSQKAAAAAKEEGEEGCLERVFRFPFDFSRPNAILTLGGSGSENGSGEKRRVIEVVLLDEPLPASRCDPSEQLTEDDDEDEVVVVVDRSKPQRVIPASLEASSAVGVQTWAASIVLSDLIVTRPWEIHLHLPFLLKEEKKEESRRMTTESESSRIKSIRIAELGAGTGLVGIVCAKVLLFSQQGSESSTTTTTSTKGSEESQSTSVVLTDYHPRVLANLRRNVEANGPFLSPPSSSSSKVTVEVKKLDWETYISPHPLPFSSSTSTSPPSSKGQEGKYDLLLAADVVYSPTHPTWLYATICHLLSRTQDSRAHVLNAIRSEGRFGEWALVEKTDEAFGDVWEDAGRGGHVGEEEKQEGRIRVLRRVELPRIKGLGRGDERGHIWWTLGWR